MKKEEKEKILDMLQDIAHAHEAGEDEFWEMWSEVHKTISAQQEDDDCILVSKTAGTTTAQ